jgi:hypothetical protein
MSMAVNGRRYAVAIERLFEPAAPKKRMDFGRLTGNGLCYGGIVQQRNSL